MRDVMSCVGACYGKHYTEQCEVDRARTRDKEITKQLKEHNREYTKRHRILLLGCGESGKSTISKQMRIIHINGFTHAEKIEKICDIKRNIKESIVSMLLAMQELHIDLDNPDHTASVQHILREAPDPHCQESDTFMDHTSRLWQDLGVHECFMRSNEYHLPDSTKYFLDRLEHIRSPNYVPTDQDILRCRVTSTSIQSIEFEVPDGNQQVRFCVYDVGGQRGERKKWIQVFDSAAAILFLVDCGAFDQNLREDTSKNRLMESLEIFEQVWRNRFLRNVSCILFINKIDILAEKVRSGHSIATLTDRYPDIFPSYHTFNPSHMDTKDFLESYPGAVDTRRRFSSRAPSRLDVDTEVVKTAAYIKHLFMKIVKGELVMRQSIDHKTIYDKTWHQHHTCEYFYTCAVDTGNIQKVLEGCRTIIIRSHLERFGII